MSVRLTQLTRWLTAQIERRELDVDDVQLQPVSGDASFRRYFRVNGSDNSWIAVDAPPDKEDSSTFVRLARDWQKHGVRVPALLAVDLAQGFMLQEDFGDSLLLEALGDASVDDLYGRALQELERIQYCPVDGLPAYDSLLLNKEMSLFGDWFVERLLRISVTPDERSMLKHTCTLLEESALAQVQLCVHRDYHSRNLMLLQKEPDRLGVIDFQDAVVGACTYDLVSLLRDSYVRWPEIKVLHWVEQFRHSLRERGLPVPDQAGFFKQFELMGMQRQLKVLGIFSRLYLRDSKAGYLGDIPRTLGYLLRAGRRYPEFTGLVAFLEDRVVPALAGHELFDANALMAELSE